MGNKKLIILIVLAVGAVISLVYGIITPSPTRRMARQEQAARTGQIESAEPAQTKRIVPLKRISKTTEFDKWQRNPFIPAATEKGTVYKPVLQGIMLYEDKPMAMINGEIVAIGGKVGEYEVVEINEKNVVLSDGQHKLELSL